MLKVGGIRGAPVEVERAITRHDAVIECAVVGHRVEDDLIKPKTFIVRKDKARAWEALADRTGGLTSVGQSEILDPTRIR